MNDAIKKLIEEMKRAFPDGHPDFIPMTIAEIELHSNKNHDYAKGGKPTGNFDRVSKILSLYPGLDISKPETVAIVYLLKQLDAALWLSAQGHIAVVQGQDERWEDVSVYSKLIRLILKDGDKK